MPWSPLDEDDEFPTLGYDVADWMTDFLLQPDCDDLLPFVPTQEELDFLVRLYELDPLTGRRVKSRAVLSRPRGWGKSPFVAAVCCVEAMGPVLCDGWDAAGQPVGVPWATRRTPLVQVTATTDDQTANTWAPLLEMLRGSPAQDEYDVDPLDSFVTMRRGRIEKRTSSATSVKGARAVMAVLDQTETWVPSNGGPKLAKTLRNNATKLGGVTIETPNAYTIGENSVAETTAGLRHGDRVIDSDLTASLEEGVDKDERRRLTHIVRLRLEGQAPDSDTTTLQITTEVAGELLEEHVLLRLVYSLDSFEDTHRTAMLLRRADEGLHILGEARASIATARVEELTPDTGITTDTLAHHGDVGTDGFAEVRHLIHEADACGQHGVGCILRHLGRRDVHEEHTEVV